MSKIASRKYRWDLEALRSGKNRLIEEKNNLEENKGVVENLEQKLKKTGNPYPVRSILKN